MKRKLISLFVCALMLFIYNDMNAQSSYAIDKGTLKVGGAVNLSSRGYDGSDRLTTFLVAPTIQTFVTPGFAIGGTINFTLISESGYSDNMFGIGPILSYYFGNEESTIYPYLSGSYLFNTELGDDYNFAIHNMRFSAGSAFMVARNVAITAEAFFQQDFYSSSGDMDTAGNTFGILGGVDVFIFGGKK